MDQILSMLPASKMLVMKLPPMADAAESYVAAVVVSTLFASLSSLIYVGISMYLMTLSGIFMPVSLLNPPRSSYTRSKSGVSPDEINSGSGRLNLMLI